METSKALQRVLDGTDTIIHLGAGRCRELPEYLAATSKRIVLAEANPRVARVLQAQSRAHENVRVVQRAISGQADEATLYVYNVAERSSLRKPTGLLELYPGLRVVEKIPVTSYSVGSLLAELDPGSTGKLCLIVDTPGEEFSILEALVRDNMHERISSLVLRCPQAQMYEGAASRQDIVELLDAHGFEIIDEAGESDLEPVLMLRLNRWKLQNGRLQTQLGSLRADHEDLRQEFSRETAKLRDVISKKDAEIQALAAKSKKYERDSNEQQDLLREKIAQLSREAKAQEVELDNSRRDLGIALRIQVLRENDLEELQQRYGAVLELKNSQHKLLMKLQERLSVAAEYLQQLKRDNRGEADDQLAQFLVRALTDGTDDK